MEREKKKKIKIREKNEGRPGKLCRQECEEDNKGEEGGGGRGRKIRRKRRRGGGRKITGEQNR